MSTLYQCERNSDQPAKESDILGEINSQGPPNGVFQWNYYPCLAFCIFVRSVPVLCTFYTIAFPYLGYATKRNFPLIAYVLWPYTLIETIFAIYYQYLSICIQARTSVAGRKPKQQRATLLRALENGMSATPVQSGSSDTQAPETSSPKPPSFLSLKNDDPRAVVWRQAQSKWFHGAAFDDLRRDNILEWLSWSCYGQHLEEVQEEWESDGKPPLPKSVHDFADTLQISHDFESSSDSEELDAPETETHCKLVLIWETLLLMEARAGQKIPDGRNPGIKSIRLHLDPVKTTARPLAFYLVTAALNWKVRRELDEHGFQLVKHEDLEYMIRMPEGWTPQSTQQPLLFLHGLGMGLAQYKSFVAFLELHPSVKDRPVVLLVQPQISMSLFSPSHLRASTRGGTIKGFKALFRRWKFNESGITVVSHSNGTIICGWLLKAFPSMIRRTCFVDPVVFCIWEGSVAYNFLYKPSETGIEVFMRYFVGQEIGIALTLQRHFDWSANLLWFEQIPRALDHYSTAFFLSENDAIIDTRDIRRYLAAHGVKSVSRGGNMTVYPNAAHGEAIIAGGEGMLQICKWLDLEETALNEKTKE